MNTFRQAVADALGHATWDDVATGLACAAFCAASASMFVVMFAT